MKTWIAIAAAACMGTLGVTGCGLFGSSVERSPEYVQQEVGTSVTAQCAVSSEPHTVRHAIRVDRPGGLSVTAAVADQHALSAELLVRQPDGMFVRQAYTSPEQRVYQFTIPEAERGTWEVVVVCRQGVSAYTVEAAVVEPVARR